MSKMATLYVLLTGRARLSSGNLANIYSTCFQSLVM